MRHGGRRRSENVSASGPAVAQCECPRRAPRPLGDDQVDNLHDRRILLDLGKATPSGRFLKGLLKRADVPCHATLELVKLGDCQLDLGPHTEHGFDPLAREDLQFGEEGQVTGVHRGDLELILLEAGREDGVLACIGLRDECQCLLLDACSGEVDERDVEVLAENACQRLLVDDPWTRSTWPSGRRWRLCSMSAASSWPGVRSPFWSSNSPRRFSWRGATREAASRSRAVTGPLRLGKAGVV